MRNNGLKKYASEHLCFTNKFGGVVFLFSYDLIIICLFSDIKFENIVL